MLNGGELRFNIDRLHIEATNDIPPLVDLYPGDWKSANPDTGQGISPEYLPIYLNPSLLPNRLGKGTGLGLASGIWNY